MRSPAQVEEVMHRLLGMDPRRRPRVEVHVFYGACGTGKTRRAMQMTGGVAYWAPARESADKWRGYRGQADIVLDDFDGKVPLHDLMTLLRASQAANGVRPSDCSAACYHFIKYPAREVVAGTQMATRRNLWVRCCATSSHRREV